MRTRTRVQAQVAQDPQAGRDEVLVRTETVVGQDFEVGEERNVASRPREEPQLRFQRLGLGDRAGETMMRAGYCCAAQFPQ